MNKLSVTITGDVDDLTKFLKAFNGRNYANNIDVKTNPISSNFKNNILTKTKYSYNYYSDNPNYSNSILSSQARLANKYIRENKTVRFLELSNYIRRNTPDFSAPSHCALKNYLINKNFQKYRIVYQDKTSEMVWEKG